MVPGAANIKQSLIAFFEEYGEQRIPNEVTWSWSCRRFQRRCSDQPDRDAVASALLRYRDVRGSAGLTASKTRDDFRRVLIRDQADRDAVSSDLMRYRDGHGDDWADIIDLLTMHPEARRRVVRILGKLEAEA